MLTNYIKNLSRCIFFFFFTLKNKETRFLFRFTFYISMKNDSRQKVFFFRRNSQYLNYAKQRVIELFHSTHISPFSFWRNVEKLLKSNHAYLHFCLNSKHKYKYKASLKGNFNFLVTKIIVIPVPLQSE